MTHIYEKKTHLGITYTAARVALSYTQKDNMQFKPNEKRFYTTYFRAYFSYYQAYPILKTVTKKIYTKKFGITYSTVICLRENFVRFTRLSSSRIVNS